MADLDEENIEGKFYDIVLQKTDFLMFPLKFESLSLNNGENNE